MIDFLYLEAPMRRAMERIRRMVMTALAASALTVGGPVLAQPSVPITRDVAGAKDHPLVPRYEGSFIIGYKTDRFGEVDVPMGPVTLHDGQRRFERTDVLEGARTRLLYVAPVQRTSLEVMRNYKDALLAAGFKALYECNRDACGDSFEVPFYFNNPSRKLNADQVMEYAFAYGVVDPRLFVGRLDRPQGHLTVVVFAAFQENSANAAAGKRVAVFVDIVESGTMERRMVTVQAPEMATNLGRDGRQAIYGIHFDFDKADIKPESTPQLAEMAKLMQANPALKVYIVGHTDNQGALDYNVGLSQRRAEAVVRALATQYGVSAARMTGRGLGPLAPVTSNATEDGRAKNRRVELVQQ
jgi:outer membrane protein OmpA-like peptidoglycan-associated protein